MTLNEEKDSLLLIDTIHTFYDTSHVLFGISLKIVEKEVVALLGRNGAGKSTTLMSVVGLTPPKSGKILFAGTEITKMKPYDIARLGIGMVPQERRIFPDLTVKENLIMPHKRMGGKWKIEDVYDIFPVLKTLEKRWGGLLSGGEQQMLAIGRTLMMNPVMLLLDEPGEGLSPLVVGHLILSLRNLNQKGLTIFLAEQNVNFASKVSSRTYVLEKGSIRYEGKMSELMSNVEIKSRYLAV
jgi:branched-chain amino acid transport system ATP-binding protein